MEQLHFYERAIVGLGCHESACMTVCESSKLCRWWVDRVKGWLYSILRLLLCDFTGTLVFHRILLILLHAMRLLAALQFSTYTIFEVVFWSIMCYVTFVFFLVNRRIWIAEWLAWRTYRRYFVVRTTANSWQIQATNPTGSWYRAPKNTNIWMRPTSDESGILFPIQFRFHHCLITSLC